MRRRATLAIAGILLAVCASSLPASAADGCIAVGTYAVRPMNHNPWDCRFTATGPTHFVAKTTNPFVIAVSRDGGESWIELSRRPVPGPPTSGTVSTLPGDMVSVSISCWNYARGAACEEFGLGGRAGVIWAQSDL